MTSFYPPNIPPIGGSDEKSLPLDGLITFDMVEEQMVEAMLLWRRMPDREHGWHAIRAFWPEMRRHNAFGDYADTEASPRPLPISRAEMAQMERVGEWLGFVADRDRRLVVLALATLAGGAKQVPWMELRKAMGVTFGAHGLRKRYSRALTAIANALNSGCQSPEMQVVREKPVDEK